MSRHRDRRGCDYAPVGDLDIQGLGPSGNQSPSVVEEICFLDGAGLEVEGATRRLGHAAVVDDPREAVRRSIAQACSQTPRFLPRARSAPTRCQQRRANTNIPAASTANRIAILGTATSTIVDASNRGHNLAARLAHRTASVRPMPSRRPGELAIVLHTHMPYVEGFGTWPFGEEWLWEAIAGCYLPLLDVLDAGAPLTLSLTPVLCDQLEAPGDRSAACAFLREIRARVAPRGHGRAARGGHGELAAELERSAAEYAAAAERLRRARAADLLGALGAARQLDLGGHARGAAAAGHRRRRRAAGADRRGVAPPPLRRLGAAASGCPSARTRRGWTRRSRTPACAPPCVELTDAFGLGDARAPAPARHRRRAGALCRSTAQTMALVWSDGGYPAAGAYRDYHHQHRPPTTALWSNDGGPTTRRRALAQARAARRATSSAASAARVAAGGRLRLRAGHRAARPLVV